MIRGLRRRQRLSLSKIAEVLPEILANRTLGGVQEPLVGGGPQTSVVAERILDVAIEAFGLHSYGEVSIAGLPQPIDMHVAAEICAWALRPGLPVLLELAKRSMLFEPEYVSEARDTFRLLAAEMGEILLPGESGSHATAGMVILDATVQVFRSLVGGRDAGDRTSR